MVASLGEEYCIEYLSRPPLQTWSLGGRLQEEAVGVHDVYACSPKPKSNHLLVWGAWEANPTGLLTEMLSSRIDEKKMREVMCGHEQR